MLAEFDFRVLAHVDAVLNAVATVLIVAGLVAIKRGAIELHKKLMLAAAGVSALFLVSYVTYHANVGQVKFTGQGPIRPVYFTLLITHVVLAVVQVPLILRTIWLGLKDRRASHRRWAKVTAPIWLYVSVTGVVVYLLLYHSQTPAAPAAPVEPAAPAETAKPAGLVGQRLGSIDDLRWLTPGGAAPDLGNAPATLFRWWTVDCPFCRDSLPDLGALAKQHAARGLRFVAVFHRKQTHAVSDDALHAYLRELGVEAILARDDQWTVLDGLRARGGLDAATSISVLVDQRGIVQWVHPGPRLHRARDGAFEEEGAEFAALSAQIERLVAAGTGR